MTLAHGSNNQFIGNPQAKGPRRSIPIDLGSSLIQGDGSGSGGDINIAPIDDGDVFSNISGDVATPIGNTVSDVLDYTLGSSQGDIIYRDASTWKVLPPGTSGWFLQTQGASANPVWAAVTGTGDVVGPGSSTDNAVVRFDGTTGKLIQNSGVLIDDSGNLYAVNGGASQPSIAFNTNYGWFYDTTNTGIGISVNGVQVGYWNTSSGVTQFITLSDGSFANNQLQSFNSTAVNASTFTCRRARGSLATPSVVQTNDDILHINAQPYRAGSGTGYSNSGQIIATITETSSVDSTHLGTQFTFKLCPIGSGTLTEVLRVNNEAGISMFGANPVLDQNRLLRMRSYTVSGLPSASTTGQWAMVSDANSPSLGATVSGGGSTIALVYSDGTNWKVAAAVGAGGGGLELTDGTTDVTGVTKITVSGMTVGGSTPNATLTVSGGIGGASFYKQNIAQSGTSTVVGRFASPYAWTLPAAGSGGVAVGKVDTAPTADTDFAVLKNGSSTTATVRFANGSTTATFINSAGISFSSGDYMDIQTPATLNGISGVWAVSILGTRP